MADSGTLACEVPIIMGNPPQVPGVELDRKEFITHIGSSAFASRWRRITEAGGA